MKVLFRKLADLGYVLAIISLEAVAYPELLKGGSFQIEMHANSLDHVPFASDMPTLCTKKAF